MMAQRATELWSSSSPQLQANITVGARKFWRLQATALSFIAALWSKDVLARRWYVHATAADCSATTATSRVIALLHFVNSSGTIVAQRSAWRISIVADAFWAVVNFIGLL
jgi:Selenoprotein SelK_SelG